ncbi:MAG: hypothetical protein LBC31_01720 [Treponema sp.]|jgi:RNA polymerase sigma factor (sigma-70 family)|nr:hypothetical protein [Treponema sp.]
MIDQSQDLNGMLAEFQKALIDRKELEGRIFVYIRNHPRRFFLSRWNPDACDDFISWLYPRLSKAVDRYSDRGSSFEAYITAMIRLSAREYALRKKDHRIIERTWWSARAAEMAVCDTEEPEYSGEQIGHAKISNPRQVLMLLLKSYHYLPESRLERLAPCLGMDKEELIRMVDELRALRLKREETIRELKERIYCQFYRCLAFEKRMQAAPVYSAHRIKMKRCLETARKRLSSMRRRLSLMRMDASNRQVAQVMKIAKGTVDSNLYSVRLKNSGTLPARQQNADI